jgi:hypothetical protein
MSDDPGRPQDAGRPHRRRGAPAPEADEILDRYRRELRAELGELLEEIRPGAGQLTISGGTARPTLEVRAKLWELSMKLARELERSAEPEPTTSSTPEPAPGRRAARAPRLTAAARRQLGGEP